MRKAYQNLRQKNVTQLCHDRAQETIDNVAKKWGDEAREMMLVAWLKNYARFFGDDELNYLLSKKRKLPVLSQGKAFNL